MLLRGEKETNLSRTGDILASILEEDEPDLFDKLPYQEQEAPRKQV